MAKVFQKGDFRSGYYRDQTFMMAIETLSVRQHFASLYADTNPAHEPASAGRQMNGHFATHSLDDYGHWKPLIEQYNSSADVSPTGSQMPRLLGLAQASKVYRAMPELSGDFSKQGQEVAFGTIGDASTSEGMFWETMNAAAVLGVPMLMSVWDDGYGISVSKKFQTVKSSISKALAGFIKAGDKDETGIKIYRVQGWNYPKLIKTYQVASHICRTQHIPVLVHVEELTQPQGHSTSGSHERYKSQERLAWEQEYDCLHQFTLYLQSAGIATEEELTQIRQEARDYVQGEQKVAWQDFRTPMEQEHQQTLVHLQALMSAHPSHKTELEPLFKKLKRQAHALRKDMISALRQALYLVRTTQSEAKTNLIEFCQALHAQAQAAYSAQLYQDNVYSALRVPKKEASYSEKPAKVDGRIILRDNFKKLFNKYPKLLTFGEDTGELGGVNQVMEGMQAEFGTVRVSDTGIRECTILGQGIGLAMRGLRPLVEIQYLDYLYYALQLMRDDLATVFYRTAGKQRAPVIIRTRGHRLEGIWHSGSPMGAIIHSVRGMHVCVPRNMTQAAGMYNTLLAAEDPALVVECLNAYRSKEVLPQNLGEFTVPLGEVEILQSGKDLTIVSYGSTLNLCIQALPQLQALGIDVELIDVQTLLPFDLTHQITHSIRKTNRVLFIDEDVPGGASAYMMDQVINKQEAFFDLDAQPITLSAQPHLPAYGSDGNYFSKPNIEDILETAYEIMHESDPKAYPKIY